MSVLITCAVIGTALVAGIFFAFSTFVLGALAKLEPRQGIPAMQSINVVVINPWFLIVFFGTGVLCATLAVLAALGDAGSGRGFVLAGAALYVIGCLGVTIGGNVPLNNRLATADPDSAEGARLWRIYVVQWGRWNHLRTAASLAAAVALAMARLGG